MMTIDVVKGTGTYADSLQAIGTASLLEEMASAQTTILDMGTHFQIKCSSDMPPEKWKQPSPGFVYIWRKSKAKKPIESELVLDYEREKEQADLRKKSPKEIKQNITVDPEYKFATILESMRKGWNSDKVVFEWIAKNSDEAKQWSKECLLKQDRIRKFKVSNSQFYNPSSGKGVYSSKTQYKHPGPISGMVVDPFAEWMKYRGAYSAMVSYRTDDDFRLFVIEPRCINPRALSILKKRLMELNLWGGIKLDIEASLRLAEELILHSDVVKQSEGIGLRGKKPASVIGGLRQAYFKSMGTAAALMNDAFFPLPDWFCIENENDANDFIDVIHEHIGFFENGERKAGCLGSLNEKHSGDIMILQQYRKWLTTNNRYDLLDFLSRFAVHIMGKREQNEWSKKFSTQNLDILFERGYGMKEIVENMGFLSIARGIRNSTIYALSIGEREVRFGLAQQWKQKIKSGKNDFIPELCDFVQSHNWEVENKLKGKGHSIKKEDLDSVLSIIEKYGTELIGMLLLAYGYARAPKVETE